MKIKSFPLLVFITVVVAMAYSILGIAYMKQQRTQGDLIFQLTQLRPALPAGKVDLTDLEKQLTAIRAQLAQEQASFPDQLSNTETVDWVLKTAQKSQIKNFILQANPVLTEKIGEHIYHVLRIEVTAEGSLSQLADFMKRLEEGTFRTLALDKAGITISQGKVIINLTIAVYAQPPLPNAITSGTN